MIYKWAIEKNHGEELLTIQSVDRNGYMIENIIKIPMIDIFNKRQQLGLDN